MTKLIIAIIKASDIILVSRFPLGRVTPKLQKEKKQVLICGENCGDSCDSKRQKHKRRHCKV